MKKSLYHHFFRFGLVLITFILGSVVVEAPTEARSFHASYIAVGHPTSVPFGWVDFCGRYRQECDEPALPALDINLNANTFAMIDRVNHMVNEAVKPITDPDHWDVVDQWDYPVDGYGDCEDYALLKRKILIDMGFPRQALLMTVVKDKQQEGHAILTMKTNHGEYVLDNLNPEILAWEDTGYHFVKRQSQEDPNVWLQLGDPSPQTLYTSQDHSRP